MTRRRSWAEPYKIKMVEPIAMTTREHREAAALAAGYNTFLLASEDVYIDLLTDSGTTAMSEHQWAGLMLGDEAYAGSRSFYNLVDAVKDVYGYEELVPTHQGRGAEHILSQILISDGDVVPGNMYFTTTKFHQEYAGGTFVDVIVDEAHDPASSFPFKGNVDMDKLKAVVDEHGADKIPYISVETNVNMAGGQPVSMANLKAVYDYCHQHDILVMLDATRAVENAFFIQSREEGYAGKSIAEILREICSYTDGATMSSKKDNLVNIGGFLALRDPELARKARALLVAFEGLHTYGGMSGRDMEALAARHPGDGGHRRPHQGPDRPGAVPGPPHQRGWHRDRPTDRRSRASSSTPLQPYLICRRITSRPRRSPLPSTWTAGCGAWSAASCRPVATPGPATTTGPNWNWSG